jgi:hypothetical protein
MVVTAGRAKVKARCELGRSQHVTAASALLEKAPANGALLSAISLGWIAFGQCHWKP